MKINFKSLLIIFFGISDALCGYAGSADEQFEQASAAYNAGQYDVAIDVWGKLYEDGYTDPDLLVNMGNALALSGRIPEAMLSYEKALRFCPGDEQLKSAIDQWRTRIGNRVESAGEFFLTEWIRAFVVFLRPSLWALIGFLLLFAGIAGWLATLKNTLKVPQIFRSQFIAFMITGTLFLFVALLSYRTIYRKNEAIVFNPCEVYQGPSVQSPLLRSIDAGEKVKIKDHLSGWTRIRLLNYDEGWLKDECIVVINPHEAQ